MPVQLPVVRAFLVCRDIVRDARSGMYSLIHICDTAFSGMFPCGREYFVYVSLIDGRGVCIVDLKLTDIDGTNVIWCGRVSVKFADPALPAEFAIPATPAWPCPGKYMLELSVDGNPLAYYRMFAVQVTQTV